MCVCVCVCVCVCILRVRVSVCGCVSVSTQGFALNNPQGMICDNNHLLELYRSMRF